MTDESKNERAGNQPRQLNLRELAHSREMDFLKVAERSKHNDIRKYALQAAKAERKHMHSQEARVSSRSALSVSAFFMLLATLVSLYAFLSYPKELAVELSWISFGGAIMLSALCFVFSDKLEASAAVELFRDFLDRLKPKIKEDERETKQVNSKSSSSRGSLGTSDSEPPSD